MSLITLLRRTPIGRHPKLSIAAAALVAGLFSISVAAAYWMSSDSSTARALADAIQPANQPSATVNGQAATVTWAASTTVFGRPVSYQVNRFAGASGGAPVAATGGCAGTVATTTCTETNLASGTWYYSVTPVLANWVGAESPRSAGATIAAPTLSFTANQLFPAVGGSLTGGALVDFRTNEAVSFHLDSAAGTTLVSATTSVDAGGSASGVTVTIPAGLTDGTHTVVAVGTGGSQATSNTFDVDAVAPTVTLSFVSGSGTALNPATNTVYYASSLFGSGNLKLRATVVDAGSGPASVTFPGASGSWSHAAETVSTPVDGPYVSNTFSFQCFFGCSSPSGYQLTTRDVAGNTTITPIAFGTDTADPTGGSIVAANSSSGTVAVTVTNYTDSASGIASNAITRAAGTLTNNVCGSTSGSTAVTLDAGYDAQTLANGCYRYTLTGTDNMGNSVSTQSATIKVDATAPIFALTDSGSGVVASGTNVFFKPGGTGAFTITTSDPESGVLSPTFPVAPAGWSRSTSTNAATYTLTAGASASSTLNIPAAANNAGGTSSAFIVTITPDTGVPTGGAISAADSTTGTVAVTVTNFADSGAGMATNTITRAAGTLTNNVCSALTGSTTVSLNAGNDAASLATGCYRYTLTGTDNVGNTASTQSATIKVDTTGPTFALSGSGTNLSTTGTTVFFKPAGSGSFTLTVSDPHTGVASTTFPNAPTGWTRTNDATSATYTLGAAASSESLTGTTASNNLGGTSSPYTVTLTADTTVPTVAISFPTNSERYNAATWQAGCAPDGICGTASDAGSGIASVAVTLKRSSDNLYWNGSAWLVSATLPATGTTSWNRAIPNTVLEDGESYSVTAIATDTVGNTSNVTTSTFDYDLPPSVVAVALSNGGAAQKADAGDKVTITYSEALNPSSICSNWSSVNGSQSSNGRTVNISNNGNSDTLTVSGCSFGSISLNADYVSGTTRTFASSIIAWDHVNLRLTITLGGSASTNNSVGQSMPGFITSGSTITDLAGNAIVGPFTSQVASRF